MWTGKPFFLARLLCLMLGTAALCGCNPLGIPPLVLADPHPLHFLHGGVPLPALGWLGKARGKGGSWLQLSVLQWPLPRPRLFPGSSTECLLRPFTKLMASLSASVHCTVALACAWHRWTACVCVFIWTEFILKYSWFGRNFLETGGKTVVFKNICVIVD